MKLEFFLGMGRPMEAEVLSFDWLAASILTFLSGFLNEGFPNGL